MISSSDVEIIQSPFRPSTIYVKKQKYLISCLIDFPHYNIIKNNLRGKKYFRFKKNFTKIWLKKASSFYYYLFKIKNECWSRTRRTFGNFTKHELKKLYHYCLDLDAPPARYNLNGTMWFFRPKYTLYNGPKG